MPAIPKALKEWVVAIEALKRGDMVVAIRKGGILEEQFVVENREFFLYPTYFHPHRDLLQPAFHADLQAAWATRPPDDRVIISAFARVVDVLPIRDLTQLRALAPHYIWTPEYIEERFRWRQDQPLLLLLLRVFTIPAQALPARSEYGGCRSWVDLIDELSIVGAVPALGEAEFAVKASAVRDVLAQPA